jgi:hypothetical protein
MQILPVEDRVEYLPFGFGHRTHVSTYAEISHGFFGFGLEPVRFFPFLSNPDYPCIWQIIVSGKNNFCQTPG